jgi:hypothetical protein
MLDGQSVVDKKEAIVEDKDAHASKVYGEEWRENISMIYP